MYQGDLDRIIFSVFTYLATEYKNADNKDQNNCFNCPTDLVTTGIDYRE